MAQVSYDEVNLMLRLYDMRREARLRQARAWFVEHFHPTSVEDMMEKYPQGSEENTYIRMVISYWEMVASIVNRGLINDELFFESNGEIWWCGTACGRSCRSGERRSRIRGCCKYRRNVQAAGSLAREACAGVERGDAQHDGADHDEDEDELTPR